MNLKYKEPRMFTMVRKFDCTGVSGTGKVLDGVVFPNGKVAVCWRPTPSCMAFYDSFEQFRQIHIDSHPINQTEILWHTTNLIEELEENPKPMVVSMIDAAS